MPQDEDGVAKILILGGTGDAAELARLAVPALAGRAEVISSLAGRTRTAAELPGRVRTGGFGGAAGLADFLRSEGIRIVIDATHPFADTISQHAYDACTTTGALRMMLARPLWPLPADGKWLEVEDMAAAAQLLPKLGRRVFLTTGIQDLDAFSAVEDVHFLVRMMEAPSEPPPLLNHEVLVARPPHDVDSERALLREHQIDCLISKHSGGVATAAKIAAALDCGVPVILIRRPPLPPGQNLPSAEDCLAWLETQI